MPAKPHICASCGQIVPPRIELPPIKQRIYDALVKRPRTSDELREIAGGYFPDHQPESRSCIYKHISQLNQYLKPRNLIVRQPVRYGRYQLVTL